MTISTILKQYKSETKAQLGTTVGLQQYKKAHTKQIIVNISPMPQLQKLQKLINNGFALFRSDQDSSGNPPCRCRQTYSKNTVYPSKTF